MATFKIMRRVRTYAGTKLVDIPHPLQPLVDGCLMHGETGDEALANLSRMGRAIRGLVAIPQEN